jgi:hypothetical protein
MFGRNGFHFNIAAGSGEKKGAAGDCKVILVVFKNNWKFSVLLCTYFRSQLNP